MGAIVSFLSLITRGLDGRNLLVGPKPLRDSSPIVARINGVQTIHQLLLRHNTRGGHTRSRADYVDSDTSFLHDLVRKCSGETDNSTLGRGVVEELILVYSRVEADELTFGCPTNGFLLLVFL